MKEFEFIEDQNSIDRIYDLELIQNKYAGVGFDPVTINQEMLYRSEDLFDTLYDIHAEDRKGSYPVDYAKVGGVDIRTYMKELLLKKNIVVIGQSDLDRYCKAFILYSTTEKNPAVTFEKNGQSHSVYETKGLRHNRDNGTVMQLPVETDRRPRMDLKMHFFMDMDSPDTKRILSNAGIDPTKEEEVKALFLTWFVNDAGKSFNSLRVLENISRVQERGMGSQFLKALESHPIMGDGVSRKAVEENLRWYGSMISGPIGNFEREYQIPSGKDFGREKYNSRIQFEYEFDFATTYAKGLNSYMDRILSNSGQGGPDNVYSVNYRKAFLDGYGGSLKEFARQKYVVDFTGKLNDLVTIDNDQYRQSEEVADRFQKDMKVIGGKTLRNAAASPKIDQLVYHANVVKNGTTDENLNEKKSEKLDAELKNIYISVFPELQVFDDKEFTLTEDRMRDKDYKKAEEVFDRIFFGVRLMEEPGLVSEGKDDIVEYFYLGDVNVSVTADEMIREKKISQEQKTGYMKARILDALKTGKKEITYKTLLYNNNNGELRDKKTFKVDSRTGAFSERKILDSLEEAKQRRGEEIRTEQYKKEAETKRKEEEAVWKSEGKKSAVKYDGFLDFYTYGNLFRFGSKVEKTDTIDPKMDSEGFMRLFSIYLLAEKDISLEQLHSMYSNRDLHGNAGKIEQLRRDFMKDIEKRPVINDDRLTGEQKQENLRWYGSLYRRAMDKAFDLGYVFTEQETSEDAGRLSSESMSSKKQVLYYCTAFQNLPAGLKRKENQGDFYEGCGGRNVYNEILDMAMFIPYQNAVTNARLNRYDGPRKNLEQMFYLRMVGEVEYIPRYSGKKLRDIPTAEYKTDTALIRSMYAVTKKESKRVYGVVSREEMEKVVNLEQGTVKEKYPEIYKKIVTGWAEIFPYASRIVSEAKAYGYKEKELTDEQKKTLEKINNIRNGKEAGEKKAEEDRRKEAERKEAERKEAERREAEKKEAERKAAEDKKKAEDNKNEINEINEGKPKQGEKPQNEIRIDNAAKKKLLYSKHPDAIDLKEFLPDDLSKEELDQIMTRTGIENPTSEDSVKFLLLAYNEHENAGKTRDRFELNELNFEKKKDLGRRFINDLKVHPVLGKVEKGAFSTEKLCVVANIAWYGSLFKDLMAPSFTREFIRGDEFTSTEKLEEAQNSHLRTYMLLSDMGLKLSKRWRDRSGRNISTKDNPYGIDMGDAFIGGYTSNTDVKFTPKSGSVPQSGREDVQKFLYDMNWFGILQIYHMTMNRILSDKTDLHQRAYLKLMTENHMLGTEFTRNSNFRKLEKEMEGGKYAAGFALKGNYIRASLDVDSKNPYVLPETYKYFNDLSEEECRKILSTPYDKLDEGLRKKVDQFMPKPDQMDKKCREYHRLAIKQQFEQAKSNNNRELFELEFLNEKSIEDPKFVQNLGEPEKQKIEHVFDLIFGPLYMEEALVEKLKNEELKLRGIKGKADIATHFGTRGEDDVFLYLDGTDNVTSTKEGYQRDELILFKARTLQLLKKDNTLLYRRYYLNNQTSIELSTGVHTWDKAVKPEPKKEVPPLRQMIRGDELFKGPAPIPVGKLHREEPKKEEPKKEEPKKEEPKKEEPKEEASVSRTVRVKHGPLISEASQFAIFLTGKFLREGAPHRLDPEGDDKVLRKNLETYCKKLNKAKGKEEHNLGNLERFLETREMRKGNVHELSNFLRLYRVLDQKEQSEFVRRLNDVNKEFDLGVDTKGLMAGKAWVNEKAKNVENKGAEKKGPEHDGKKVFMKEIEPEPQPERTPAESRAIYTRAMTDMHNTNVMAIYARQCLGNLEYVKAKDIGAAADDQYKDLEEKLSAVAALSDESKPQESKEKIDDMLSAVNTYISDNAHDDNATLKTICLNLKSFRKAARAYYQENDIQTEEDKTYKQILEDEYPNMMRGVSENEKRRFSIEAEKQRESIRKLLKKVRENFKELKNCNPQGVANSVQFNRMFAAAERANNLTENSTMMEIRKAISDVHATASIYNDKINAQGLFGGQLIVGKKKGYYRHQAAMNLKNVSIDLLFRMDYMTDPYQSLPSQITHPTVNKGSKQKNSHPELKIGK